MASNHTTHEEPPASPGNGGGSYGYGYGNAASPQGQDVGLRHYAAVLLDYWWLVLLCLLAGAGVGAWRWHRQAATPLYRATCRVEITADPHDGSEGRGGALRQSLVAEELQQLTILLRSETVQRKVCAALRADRPDLPPPCAQISVATVRGWDAMLDVTVDAASSDLALAYLNQLFTEYDTDRAQRIAARQKRATAGLELERDSLQSQLAEARSELLTFQIRENTVLTEAKAAFDDRFLADLVQRENSIRMERTMMEGQFAVLENASAATINDLLDLDLETHRITLRKTVAEAGTEADKESAKDKESAAAGVGSALFADDNAWQTREEKLARLQTEYQDSLRIYKPHHPKMVELSRRVELAKSAIQVSTETALQRLRARHRALAIQEDSLATAASQWKSDLTLTSTQRANHEELKAKVEHLNKRYEQVCTLVLDTKVAQGDSVYRNLAEAPTAKGVTLTSARQDLVTVLGMALMLGVGLALLLDHLDLSLRDPESIEERLGLAYLHAIPHWSQAAHGFHRAQSAIAMSLNHPNAATEGYRNLRGVLERSVGEGGSYALLVTSARPAEGKSVTALNLAIAFAWAGKRVLLIDGDLRRGALAGQLGLTDGNGLSDVLSGDTPDWHSAVQGTAYPSLSFLACGSYRQDAPELLRPGRFREIVTQCRGAYDLVILDSPPIGKVIEPDLYGRVCDGTLLVTRFGKTRYDDVRHAVRHLGGANVLGFCVNGVKLGRKRYGRAYAGEYYGAKDYARTGSHKRGDKTPEVQQAA